ncbi:MAG: phosphoglycerate kinase [Candidatus Marinimicrobia bacterium]|jgi:3-phosphoglycerate kinase|nr:phosphoglycerate kinase [Candidatus Neomarinimicrobiota bacterium]
MIKNLHTFDLKDKRILMRVDFNVPLNNGRITDDFRLRAALPTIQHCLEQGAAVVLMSHLGRPKGKIDDDMSLIPVGEHLADLLEMPIKFSDDCISEDALDTSLGISAGEIHLLENLRFHNEETLNDSQFSMLLAKHGEVFINEAFGTAHRAHASNVGVVHHFKQKGMGFLMEKELKYLKDSFDHPRRPVTLILGGAKIDTKLSLILRFLNKADTIIISGGMAFTFIKAKGQIVGGSLIDENMIASATHIMNSAKNNRAQLIYPSDFVCSKNMDSKPKGVYLWREIPKELMGLDIGPKSIERFKKIISSSKTVLWNGPMGVFEKEFYSEGTKVISEALSEETENGQTTIVGGGDTAAAVRSFGHQDNVSHVSTGGGASLELLSGETLPAFSALES